MGCDDYEYCNYCKHVFYYNRIERYCKCGATFCHDCYYDYTSDFEDDDN